MIEDQAECAAALSAVVFRLTVGDAEAGEGGAGAGAAVGAAEASGLSKGSAAAAGGTRGPPLSRRQRMSHLSLERDGAEAGVGVKAGGKGGHAGAKLSLEPPCRLVVTLQLPPDLARAAPASSAAAPSRWARRPRRTRPRSRPAFCRFPEKSVQKIGLSAGLNLVAFVSFCAFLLILIWSRFSLFVREVS